MTAALALALAVTGSAFIDSLRGMDAEAREAAIAAALRCGNVPRHVRRPATIRFSASGADGVSRRVTLRVLPDYLAIGTDRDFVRMPMRPATAETFLEAFGYSLPTRRVVQLVWEHAAVRLWPAPLVEDRESPSTFLRHDRLIREQLRGRRAGALVAGHKKDVVLTARLAAQPDRVAIFGWHKPTGEPIQPLSLVHRETYVDYSHGVRPVWRRVAVDGAEHDYLELLADPRLHPLLSDEGPIDLRPAR